MMTKDGSVGVDARAEGREVGPDVVPGVMAAAVPVAAGRINGVAVGAGADRRMEGVAVGGAAVVLPGVSFFAYGL